MDRFNEKKGLQGFRIKVSVTFPQAAAPSHADTGPPTLHPDQVQNRVDSASKARTGKSRFSTAATRVGTVTG